jgi:hypothetical protein
VTPPDQLRALAAEIQDFLSSAKDVGQELQQRFRPDIVPTEFAPTTRDFLERIAALTH